MNEQTKKSLFLRELNAILKGSGGKITIDGEDSEVFMIVCRSEYFRNTQLNPSDFLIKKIEAIGKRYFRLSPRFNNTRTCFWFE
ncbi:hypothetical protein FCV82_02170 [Vibrio breoganii]|uniref:hypothetical protein n=1 Tax=Vibrio breoganii TaxID=553239 RepID=UPI000C839B72|nr:hypothetical protein [Vibrio breoganii]PMN67102.1 hypothetical protein BCT28_03870 [Vibrio breoganii]PMO82921.1 hypothetical protein BCT00_06730 [Vibrio breoganii]TKF90399.1 hypothetical protein FCV82_02170 [Vibrio breoganii]